MHDQYYDAEHLRLLSVFHYVTAGLAALVGSLPLIHVALGVLMVTGQLDRPGQPEVPAVVGWLFIAVGGLFVLFGWTLAVLLVLGGVRLARRQSYTFCMVVAGVACLFMPFGTVLGVFTILLLV